MLEELRIRGLAVIDDLTLELGPGMNVLTGETGAGKSIVVDALLLLRGVRGRSDLVRAGRDHARVQAQFSLPGPMASQLHEVLAKRGIAFSPDDALILERTVARQGKGRASVQADLTTLDVLSEVGGLVLDICSQHEHHSLTQVGRHVDVLDAFADCRALVGEYERAYRAWGEAKHARRDLAQRLEASAARAHWLRFQLEELHKVAPEPGEAAALSERAAMLRSADRFRAIVSEVHARVYGDDDAMAATLAGLCARLRRLPDLPGPMAELLELLDSAASGLDEAARVASRVLDRLGVDPGELDAVEARLDALDRLRRKLGCEVEALAGHGEALESELALLDDASELAARAEEALASAHARALGLAQRLSQARREAAARLEQALREELQALHLPSARLVASIDAIDARDEDGRVLLGARGIDRVEFLFAANVGEPPAPLQRVASGGELSRVLLAIKSALDAEDRVATYVFDEVDAGVGGAVADAIGRRLRRAAHPARGQPRQVLCITHLPQIAAFADTHYRVRKRTVSGRTVTVVERLDKDERVEELARMLGGAAVTESARRHARALLEHAHLESAPAPHARPPRAASGARPPAKKRGGRPAREA